MTIPIPSTSSILLAIIILVVVVGDLLQRRRKLTNRAPPVVAFNDQDIFVNPKQAFASVLQKYGPVVAIQRKSRMEYIVDHTLTAEVLTNDRLFSFERGTLNMLNLHPLLYLRSFMRDIENLVQEDIIKHLDESVRTVAPVLERHVQQILQESGNKSIDVAAVVHRAMSEAMLLLILGETYTNDQNITSVEIIAKEVATLTGIYENLSPWARTFPSLMRVLTWMRVAFIALPYHFVFGIGFRLFCELSNKSLELKPSQAKVPVIFKYAQRLINKRDGRLSLLDRIWITSVVILLIFASVHQTAIVIIWVILELAKRPEFVEDFRAEIRLEQDADGTEHVTCATLDRAEKLDSFIREVMRTKGDTLSTVRMSTQDVPLGGYIIPKNSFVMPIASLSHENEDYHGETARSFIGDRWVGTGKPAIMVGKGYFPFGLGRWACPGRALAVAEIKLMVMHLIAHATPMLEGGSFEVVDPLNTASVPPKGRLVLT